MRRDVVMRKSLIGALCLFACVSIGAVVAHTSRTDATAQEDVYISVTILERRLGWSGSNLIEGSSCWFTGESFGNYNSNRMHIVVKDEEGVVIAVQEVEGVIVPNVEFDFYTCEAIFEMPLPDAEFYTVYVNDTYYVTVSSDGLNYIPLDIVREGQEDWHPTNP
jgi:hypothetical protein